MVLQENCGLFPLFGTFLAAMSSSRSDDVTKSVCVSVVIFLVCSIQGIRCFKDVITASHWCLFEVSRVFGRFKDVLSKF